MLQLSDEGLNVYERLLDEVRAAETDKRADRLGQPLFVGRITKEERRSGSLL
jgi:hypothetical protein